MLMSLQKALITEAHLAGQFLFKEQTFNFEMSMTRGTRTRRSTVSEREGNNSVQFFARAETTATRPITDTAQYRYR
jgi:hypothetical protein